MANYTIKGLTEKQNELLNNALGEELRIHGAEIRTANKLSSLGLGRRFTPQGMMDGSIYSISYAELNAAIEVIKDERLPFGRYIEAKLIG